MRRFTAFLNPYPGIRTSNISDRRNLSGRKHFPACRSWQVFVILVTFMSLASNSAACGIRFNDCLFTEPVVMGLPTWIPPGYPGILAILLHNPEWAPKSFQPIYFVEFGNNAFRNSAPIPQDYPRLLAAANGRTLYVSILPMPFSTTAERRRLRNELVLAYNPEWQTEDNVIPQGELAAQLSDLEKKYREQTAQVSFLLANIGQVSQPPRHRIGFMPDTETIAA
ncbi:MAG TPA: hypothetical protein VHZ74_22240 [Bryobacteraceae bacterium]|nr:hypothetical protein [Bryobacteraceae bacterium]